MKKHALLIVWIIVITFVVGIAWWSIAAYMGGSRSQSTEYKPSPSQAIALITKNGTPLSYKYWVMPNELQDYMQSFISNYKKYYGKTPDSLFEEPKMQVDAIKQLVDQKIVNYFADTSNINVVDSEVNSQVKSIVAEYTSNPQTKEYIVKQYGSVKNFEDKIRPNVKQSLVTQKVMSLVANITENDVKSYYESHKEDVENKYDEVKSSHILLSTQATADKILKLIRSKKIAFSEAAKKYSKDTGSATNGGELGWFTRNQMVSQFSDAAFSATPGEIVGPIQTQYGWHLINVEGKRMFDNFNAVKSATTVYNDLSTQVKNKKFFNWLEKYKKEEKLSYQIQGQVLPYVKVFYSISATNTTKLQKFIDELGSYVYPTKGATVNTSIDPRLLALYEMALETYQKALTSQNAALESYHYSTGTLSATYVGLPLTTLQKKLEDVSEEMDKATGTAFSRLFNEKLDIQKALNYGKAREELEKQGYKTDKEIKKAYEDYQKKMDDLSKKTKEVLEALYKVAPYSSEVVTKLYRLDPSNKKVALQYFQNEYKLIEPIISNKQTFETYSSQITPYLGYIKSGLESLAYSANATNIKEGALVTLISMNEKMGNYKEELGYLEQLRKVNSKYPGLDQTIKQIRNALSATSTKQSQATPTLKIPTPSGK